MNEFSLSVVIPATDESCSLTETVEYIEEKCAVRPEKVIIVLSRNASEACCKAAEELKNRYGDYVDITVQKEDGLGCAVQHGIDELQTSHMTFFPADLALELESLDRMILSAKASPDIIFKTSRWKEKDSFVEYDRVRLVLNRIAQIFLRVLFLSDLTDLTNPVQIIPSEYQKSIKWREKGFCILIEQTIVPIRLGYKIKEVPAKCYPRTEGKSKNSWMQTALYLKTAFRVRFTPKSKLYK
ncbi:MAG: glycosyltransferase [Lachnospiraceae bacterium]|nr:glycosyltransferase [Lachnospiraceae bacterium]